MRISIRVKPRDPRAASIRVVRVHHLAVPPRRKSLYPPETRDGARRIGPRSSHPVTRADEAASRPFGRNAGIIVNVDESPASMIVTSAAVAGVVTIEVGRRSLSEVEGQREVTGRGARTRTANPFGQFGAERM